MSDNGRVRHSKAENSVVVTDDIEKARLEASNAVKQAERVRQLVMDVVDGKQFRLRPSTFLGLNRCAIEGLDAFAGSWRPAGIGIGESRHEPPGAHLVPELAEELCEYINEEWAERSAIHLSAMVMWRLNWIHPFTEGNGRTSRAASYLVLCAKTGSLLPGTMTIPEQIVENREPYYEALEDADLRYVRDGMLAPGTVEKMEALLGAMLARQLRLAFDEANGR